MTRACALKGGDWLLERGLAGRKVNDLAMADLEGFAVAVISELILQYAREATNHGPVPDLEKYFTG